MANEVASLKERYTGMLNQQPIPDADYYAITLLGTEGGILYCCQTAWCEYTDTKPRREVREGSHIKPDIMLKNWRDLEEPGVVVNDTKDLMLYVLVGGNAIVEDTLAKAYFANLISPHVTVFSHTSGRTSLESVPKQLLQHAPPQKLRMRVIKRDNYRCKICGRSPETCVDIELHVHHIHPWGNGGLTEEDNLITICGTCHGGLEPHFDYDLFRFIGVAPYTNILRKSPKYRDGVRLYREHSVKVFKQMNTPAPSKSSL